MSTYDNIKKLCDERGVAVTLLEQELGFGRGSIGKMKKGSKTSYDRLQKIADYFSVSVEELNRPNVTSKPNAEHEFKKMTDTLAKKLVEQIDFDYLIKASKEGNVVDVNDTIDVLIESVKKGTAKLPSGKKTTDEATKQRLLAYFGMLKDIVQLVDKE